MSIIESNIQQLHPDGFAAAAYAPDASPSIDADAHDTVPYWPQQFAEDPVTASATWMEQAGYLPVDESAVDLDPVAIYQQAFAQKRASLAGWRVWRRWNTGEPDQAVVDELTNSAASLCILRDSVTIDETTITE